MMIIAALFPLLALMPLASAQLPASAPHCVATCLQAKINEAGSLAPRVQPSDIAGLCATSAFVEAYDNLTSSADSCSDEAAELGRGGRRPFAPSKVLRSGGEFGCVETALTGSASSKLASASSSIKSEASDATSEAEGSVFTTVASATSSASGTRTSTASGSESISSSFASVTSSLASEVSSRASGSAAAASASQGNGNSAFAIASPSIFTAFISSVVLGALAVFA
ncbi:hypothetical protein C6P46_004157 [Rhodotorula mucilaginosa]|uniref:Extracellular membrane protein CFEM domain-containing protein n=1 Tax=Rhodotorula mucilaginosa TaxID=5537 RepID=A0A9P6W2Z9_RHOMI|nr:hypothetical protein C6P46_004157 [Rhodotorula mucilaginosa]